MDVGNCNFNYIPNNKTININFNFRYMWCKLQDIFHAFTSRTQCMMLYHLIPLIGKTNICFNQLLLGYSHNKSFCYISKIGFVGLIDKYIFVERFAFFVLENMCYINVSKSTSFIRLNHNFFTIMKQITTFLVLKYIFL